MDLNKSAIKAKRPCSSGYRWFLNHSPEGAGYQSLIDALVDEGRLPDACWLVDNFGVVNSRLVLEGVDLEALVFAGDVEIRGNLHSENIVRVGGALRVHGSVRVGREINVQGDMVIDGNLSCGGNVTTGGSLRVAWGADVKERLRCGHDLKAGWGVACGDGLSVGGLVTVGRDLVSNGSVECAKSVKVDGSFLALDSVKVGHGLIAGEMIQGGMHLEVGWGIQSGAGVIAKGVIIVGESIHAAGEICAGPDFGVFAGTSVMRELWPTCASVRAIRPPDNLMSGHWAGADVGGWTACRCRL